MAGDVGVALAAGLREVGDRAIDEIDMEPDARAALGGDPPGRPGVVPGLGDVLLPRGRPAGRGAPAGNSAYGHS